MSIQIDSLYPDAARDFDQGLNKCSSIPDQNFEKAKSKICQFVETESKKTHLDSPIRKEPSETTAGHYQWTAFPMNLFTYKGNDEEADVAMMQEGIGNTPNAARNISDSQFLAKVVKSEIVQSSILKSVAEEAQKIAISYLQLTISHLVRKIVSSARVRQEEQHKAQIREKLSSLRDGEQRRQRSQFINQINSASNQSGDV